ncbi:MAG: hypothetical protein PUA61_06755 [Succinatimonas hippei]|nr:hypothetical protein [Succinatimonas hippei]
MNIPEKNVFDNAADAEKYLDFVLQNPLVSLKIGDEKSQKMIGAFTEYAVDPEEDLRSIVDEE